MSTPKDPFKRATLNTTKGGINSPCGYFSVFHIKTIVKSSN
ncbi:hypothetical protein D3OALGB2SA_4334 [Olavius algarvensis associated proteobacterium Delta 3]|nr:hypothetical protein D3OALGB2SA_4334 [Olavius algarvensis associated proteobacterium Delta 3]